MSFRPLIRNPVFPVAGFLGLLLLSLYIAFRPPKDFPIEQFVVIPGGTTVRSAAMILKDGHVISQESAFILLVSLFSPNGVKAGTYALKEPESLSDIAWRFSFADFHLIPVRITVPEGSMVEDIKKLCVSLLPNCKAKEFLTLTAGKEGYLFPDTYVFPPTAGARDIVALMEENFNKKIASISDEVKSFGKSLKDVVIMASIIEAEARTPETRRLVSGILWRRMSLGIPLQVDAGFRYINGKDSYSLVTEDLSIDSPYNTYLYKGLPIGPINNPGLDALLAAIQPTKSPYLYYLTDKAGNFYFAKTHDEHVLNKEKYLGM